MYDTSYDDDDDTNSINKDNNDIDKLILSVTQMWTCPYIALFCLVSFVSVDWQKSSKLRRHR